MSGVGHGSFEAFVAERSTPLLRTAYLLSGDRRSAEDLLQTALIRAYRHWDREAVREDPAAFVRRVLVTTHAGWRRLMRVGELVAGSSLLAGVSAPAADPGLRDETTSALAQLPARTRAVLVLRSWEDLSAAGTAEVLGCSVDTVHRHTTRGLARLRELLGDTDDDSSAAVPAATGTTGSGRAP